MSVQRSTGVADRDEEGEADETGEGGAVVRGVDVGICSSDRVVGAGETDRVTDAVGAVVRGVDTAGCVCDCAGENGEANLGTEEMGATVRLVADARVGTLGEVGTIVRGAGTVGAARVLNVVFDAAVDVLERCSEDILDVDTRERDGLG